VKLISAKVENFASYKELALEFNDLGLCLVNGPTGAGKSTLCDIVPWILFGKTAKNGTVDEVRPWSSEASTKGILIVALRGKTIAISRQRAPNDLYFSVDDGLDTRGKDLTDTQQLINNILGLDLDTYLSGAYYHEFSQSASFFTANAKTRRAITDQMVDLEFTNTLVANLADYKKLATDMAKSLETEIKIAKGSLDTGALENYKLKAKAWDAKKASDLADAEARCANFEENKEKAIKALIKAHNDQTEQMGSELVHLDLSIVPREKIEAALKEQKRLESLLTDEVCNVCGTKKDSSNRMVLIKQRHKLEMEIAENDKKIGQLDSAAKQYKKHVASLDKLVETEKNKENKYLELIQTLKSSKNPYNEMVEDLTNNLTKLRKDIESKTKDLSDIKNDLSDISILQDLSGELRSILISNAVSELESNTNRILETYFDGELRVQYTAQEADKLLVVIQKDGNECSYTQLSKGQRQLLKLSFGVSAMGIIANRYMSEFNTIFLDEALDGLDANLKVKAYGLLNELSMKYENVLVVEHSTELKALFDRQISVKLVNGESQIEKA
jgi:DNA repair exonuclease SbcCD ATPase subunit